MFLPKPIIVAFGVGVTLSLLAVALIAATDGLNSSSNIPQVLSYHGTLTDHNSVPLQGTKTMTFRLYDTAEGGAPLWEETRGVSLQDGRFQVLLGTVVSFPGNLWANAPLYLGVQMAGSDELLPRQLVASVVHAITAGEANVAEDANALNGRLASSFADAGHTHAGDDIISRVAQAQDSDTVDGQHASAFAASSHNHGGGDITSAVAQATNASNAANADTVDGFHASSSPLANALLALNGSGRFPDSVVGVSRCVVGSYVGDYVPTTIPVERTIDIGFTPDFVLILGETSGGIGMPVHLAIGPLYATDFGDPQGESGASWRTDPGQFRGIVASGFMVIGAFWYSNYMGTNTQGVVYHYIALKR